MIRRDLFKSLLAAACVAVASKLELVPSAPALEPGKYRYDWKFYDDEEIDEDFYRIRVEGQYVTRSHPEIELGFTMTPKNGKPWLIDSMRP